MPLSVLLGANPYIDANSVTGFPLSLPSGRGTADISYNIISTTMSSYPAVYPLNFLLKLIICKDDTVQWDQISDGDFDETYVYYVNGYTATTTKSSFVTADNRLNPSTANPSTRREPISRSQDIAILRKVFITYPTVHTVE